MWCTQTVFLSKQVPTIVAGRLRDAQMIKVLGAYTLLRLFVTTKTIPPGAKRPLCMASAFLGKCASVTAVDLIQRKKLNFRNFYESNLTEARFGNLILYRCIRIITVACCARGYHLYKDICGQQQLGKCWCVVVRKNFRCQIIFV